MTIEIHRAFKSRIKLNVRQTFHGTFSGIINDLKNISDIHVNHKCKCIRKSNIRCISTIILFYFQKQSKYINNCSLKNKYLNRLQYIQIE